eukprot:TRINITY_DN1147_c0_g1_i1.p1 TRINITY_DN1147_c0_g1~~TRINITY_DN1147_c0_g1_i1.p1  ORF type:complete len:811 (-),score=124.46 TRINITY_DN1147_c0_g1_i1:501-2933(-)
MTLGNMWSVGCLAFVGTMAAATALHELCCRHRRSPEGTALKMSRRLLQGSDLFRLLVTGIEYSFIIPLSLNLAEALDGNAGISGWIISVGGVGFILGGTCSWFAWRRCSQQTCRRLAVLSLWVPPFFYGLFGVLLQNPGSGDRLLGLLLTIRLCSGIAFGISELATFMVRSQSPSEEQVAISLCYEVCLNGGVCLGPLLTSTLLEGAFSGHVSVQAAASVTSYLIAVLSALSSLLLAVCIPSHALQASGQESESEKNRGDTKVVLIGLFVLCSTAFNASAIEVGTSFMLETEFGMEPKAIGFFIGIVFAISAGLCILTTIVRELGLSPDWVTMIVMQAIALAGMPFLIDVPMVKPGKYQLLLADSLVYPSIVTTSGIAYGLAFASVGSSTFLTQETLTLAFIWSESVGRIIAGPLVRTVLEHWGRNCYAGVQFVTLVLGMILGLVSPVLQQGANCKEPVAEVLSKWDSSSSSSSSEQGAIDEEAEARSLPRLLGRTSSSAPSQVDACQPMERDGREPVMSETCFNYAGWKIKDLEASKTFPGTAQPEAIKLVHAEAIPYQGWWPQEPAEAPKIILAGCCLFDGRWQARCCPRGKGNPPAIKSLSSATRRDELFARLKKGHKVECVFVPRGLSQYHRRVIRWQAEALKVLQPEKVIYHLPVQEYHHYIDEFETHLGVKVDRMHELLDEFGQAVKREVERCLSPFAGAICFLEPMKSHGCERPDDSFLWPYLNVHEFGDTNTIAGLEDLPEMYLSSAASKQTGTTIPVLCGILAVHGDPYRQGELKEGEIEEVQIQSLTVETRERTLKKAGA